MTKQKRENLIQKLKIDDEIQKRIKRNPLKYAKQHKKQKECTHALEVLEKIVVALFWGNRVGKTEWGAQMVAKTVLGDNPIIKTPAEVWSFCPSFDEQKDTTQEKLLRYIPEHRIKDRVWLRKGILRELILDNGSKITFKCHPAGSRVNMADGTLRNIEDIDIGDEIINAHQEKKRIAQKHIYKKALVLDIVLRGHRIKATRNHPFYVIDKGWVNAENLSIGDVVQTASFGGNKQVASWRSNVLGILISDGCLRGKTAMFTTMSSKVVERITQTIPNDMRVVKINSSRNGKADTYKISSKKYNKCRLKEWLEELNLWNKKAENKFIPKCVFEWNRKARIEFLEMLWAGDGTVNRLGAVYTSCSKQLSLDVQALLWTMGIHSEFRQQKERHFTVSIYGKQREDFDRLKVPDKTITYFSKHIKKRYSAGEIIDIKAHNKRLDVYSLGVNGKHELIVEGLRVGNSYEQGRAKAQGAGKSLIWFDEEPPKDIWEECFVRQKAGTILKILLTMTAVLGMTWVYNDIYLKTDNSDIFVSQAGWDDNPWLLEEQKTIMARGLSASALKVRREGLFIKMVGLVCAWFDRDIHLIDMKELPIGDDYMGLDFGFSNPSCSLWVRVDREFNFWIFDGFYRKGMTNPDIQKLIKLKEHGLERVSRVADSAQASDIKQLNDAGISIVGVKKEVGTSKENWDEYRARLMEERGRVNETTNKPKIFISKKLVDIDKEGLPFNFLVKEIENLRWEEVKTDMGIEQKPVWGKQPNHAIDALSYILTTITKPVEKRKPYKEPDYQPIFDTEGA